MTETTCSTRYKGIYCTALRWRKRYPAATDFSDAELQQMYERTREPHAERPSAWDDFFDSPHRPTEDFMQERIDLPVQNRSLFE